jgi:hypothetical protein
MNLSQRTPRGKEMLKLPHRLAVITLKDVDCPAGKTIAICRHIIWSAQAEISEKNKACHGFTLFVNCRDSGTTNHAKAQDRRASFTRNSVLRCSTDGARERKQPKFADTLVNHSKRNEGRY